MLSRWQTAPLVGCLRYHHCSGFLSESHLGWLMTSQHWLVSPGLRVQNPSVDKVFTLIRQLPAITHKFNINQCLKEQSTKSSRKKDVHGTLNAGFRRMRHTGTLESAASSRVPSVWMTGCWILTSIPWSSRLDLHNTKTHLILVHSSWKTSDLMFVCSSDFHWPGAICICIRDKGGCGDKWAVQVLTNVDLLSGGSTVSVPLSRRYVNRLPLTLNG